MRTRSAKKAKADNHLATVRALVLARDGGCTFTRWGTIADDFAEVAPPRCCAGGLHAHHIRRRSQGGPHTMDNLTTLCAAHHGWVHDHPALARLLGLLR